MVCDPLVESEPHRYCSESWRRQIQLMELDGDLPQSNAGDSNSGSDKTNNANSNQTQEATGELFDNSDAFIDSVVQSDSNAQ